MSDNIEKKSEPLLSKKRKELLSNPMDSDNPITIQVLGICSALAVTIALEGTVIMAIAVFFVLVMANVIISALRNTIPNRIRIIVQLVVVASLVAVVDQVLRAFAYEQSKALSVFVGLIITNCIVMGRLEAFALGNKPWDSFLDGVGNAVGYGWIIIAIAFVRELFGAGKLFGQVILSKEWYVANGFFATPAAACIILGVIIWVLRARSGYVED
ncbi:MAG: NADH:ubiquinone reductase (Na(+)-transporting) subunit D [Bacteroidetes bacterium]|jgi:Na+-transporting NADH:ubiquinone oxidoreductase subunit D|nr:NADH:ubiquinone reductase (Na(+)-transporting) subunit D [Bacteroidota bacterium]MDA8930464.1 NADH:ubiquinone reductase (Na(+)-transporting) subunit D [Bacteroidia bacterium]